MEANLGAHRIHWSNKLTFANLIVSAKFSWDVSFHCMFVMSLDRKLLAEKTLKSSSGMSSILIPGSVYCLTNQLESFVLSEHLECWNNLFANVYCTLVILNYLHVIFRTWKKFVKHFSARCPLKGHTPLQVCLSMYDLLVDTSD